MDILVARLAEKELYRRSRLDLVRAKARVYRHAQVYYPGPSSLLPGLASWEEVLTSRAGYVRRHYRNRACSCLDCLNPRYFGKGNNVLTLQERRLVGGAA